MDCRLCHSRKCTCDRFCLVLVHHRRLRRVWHHIALEIHPDSHSAEARKSRLPINPDRLHIIIANAQVLVMTNPCCASCRNGRFPEPEGQRLLIALSELVI